MPIVDDLFDRYRAAYRAGEAADPRPYLDELSGADREELGALIDAFLAHDSGRRGRPDALTQRIGAAVAERLGQPAETWATLLPRARDQAQVSRATLVQRLARALGVADRETKVAGYYHRMESGTIEPSGVSSRVLEALSDIVGIPAERLREAGRHLGPAAPGNAAVFARSAAVAPAAMAELAADLEPEPEHDEVDELFTGGG